MKFKDIFFSKEKYFSVGIEEYSGEYYISIPVSNLRADYEEYYRLDKNLFNQYENNLSQLGFIADECRKRLRDKDLLIQPGVDRGVPM